MRINETKILDNIFPIVCLASLVIVVIVLTVTGWPINKTEKADEYRLAISPVHLKEKNTINRREWVNKCIDHVGGGTTLAECTLSAKELYPEQDWVELAKSNMATMRPKAN